MALQAAHLPLQGTLAGFRRFTVAEYHRLIELGILTEDDNLELLDGYLVHKMPRNPAHDAAIQKGTRKLLPLLPAGWDLRVQSAITLTGDNQPEPDFAIVRGDETTFVNRHPGPADIDLLIEVSNTSLAADREDKAELYSRVSIARYWIVNLLDRQVEEYSLPSGPTSHPEYMQRVDYPEGTVVPMLLGSAAIQLAVQDLLP